METLLCTVLCRKVMRIWWMSWLLTELMLPGQIMTASMPCTLPAKWDLWGMLASHGYCWVSQSNLLQGILEVMALPCLSG